MTDLLDQIDRLDQQATKGPWHVAPEEDEDGSKFPWAIFGPKNDLWGPQGWDHEHYIQEIPELTIPDAEFIALARTFAPAAAKALRTILTECESFEIAHDDEDNPFHQGVHWTVMAIRQAITDAMGADNA